MPATVSRRVARSSRDRGAAPRLHGVPALGDLLFHLLVRLPRVQVGRHGRADHRHHQFQVFPREFDARDEGAPQRTRQVRLGQQRRADIREQGQRQPAEGVADHVVGREALQREHRQRHRGDQPRDRHRQEDVERRRHAAEIGRRLDDVADDHADQQGIQHPARIERPDRVEQRAAGHHRQLRRQVHHDEGHRQHHGGHPEQRVAEPGAGARIGADGGRVVVRGARDQPQADGAGRAGLAPGRVLRLRGPGRFRCIHAHAPAPET